MTKLTYVCFQKIYLFKIKKTYVFIKYGKISEHSTNFKTKLIRNYDNR